MVEIEFHDDGRVVKGILLGKYQRPHDEVYPHEKKFLWKRKTTYVCRTLNTPLYVIFIPWKYRIKELREVDEKFIVNPHALGTDETWVAIDRFISETSDGYIYPSSLDVKDYVGYKFMYDNHGFIADLCLHNFEDCLRILYKNMPEVLDIDLGNIEE